MAKDKQACEGSKLLKSVMQESFVDNILQGMYQTDAYLAAYPTCKNRETAKVNASRLLTNANVKARLAYRRAELAKKVEVTEETQIKRFRELSQGAEQKGQYSAAVSAEDRITTICDLYERDNVQKGKTLIELVALVGAERRKAIDSKSSKLNALRGSEDEIDLNDNDV